MPSIKKAKDGDISKRFCEPLFATYTLPKSYFDTDLKKLVDANSERTRKMLKLYDLTPTAYELATSPFYNDKREFTLYFGKKTVLFLNTGALLRIFKFRLIVSSKRKRALQG